MLYNRIVAVVIDSFLILWQRAQEAGGIYARFLIPQMTRLRSYSSQRSVNQGDQECHLKTVDVLDCLPCMEYVDQNITSPQDDVNA